MVPEEPVVGRPPDFVCIGAQKSGTTWLYDALRWQPGVFMPAIKELHYFTQQSLENVIPWCEDLRLRQINTLRAIYLAKEHKSAYEERSLKEFRHIEKIPADDDWYRGVFAHARVGDICGEVCPSYMSLPSNHIQHLITINPDVRIILVIRDPIDRFWSQVRMDIEHKRLKWNLEEFLSRHLEKTIYMKYTDYAQAIPRWLAAVGEDRLCIVVQDEIESNPELVYSKLLSFIGVPFSSPRNNLRSRVNRGEDRAIPKELHAKLFTLLELQYKCLHAYVPDFVDRWRTRHQLALDSITPCQSEDRSTDTAHRPQG